MPAGWVSCCLLLAAGLGIPMFHKKTVAELSAGLHKKEFSSVELTQGFLGRIDRHQALNAFITLDPEKSLAQARAADARRARGEAAALTGIPIAQKDIFCADGWRTTCGSRMLSNFVAPYDATARSEEHTSELQAHV